MHSDSPVIITDGSLEIYSARGDFDNPAAASKTYHINKKAAATSIKFFGTKIPLGPADTWRITVNGASGSLAIIAPHPESGSVRVIANNDLTFRDDHMAGATNSDPVVSISVSVNGGPPKTFQSDCHIRFR